MSAHDPDGRSLVPLLAGRSTTWRHSFLVEHERNRNGPSPPTYCAVRTEHPAEGVATSGSIDTEKARARGAEVSEKAAIAAERVKETVSEAALTTKIKAKMVFDDYVKARSINVNTKNGTVTLRGVVRSVDEHDRALTLARDTVGVTQVVDELRVEAQ